MKQAVSSPLLETTIEGASHVIINISGDISLIEANEAASYVQELAGEDANIIFGAMYDENAQDEASITVIATGLDEHGATPSVAKAMTGFTNFKKNPAAPGSARETGSQAAAPEAAATTASSYTRQTQGYTPSYKPAGNTANQGYNGPRYNQGQYGSGSTNSGSSNPSPAPSFRPTANKEMQINIPDFLKNKR